MDLWGKFVAMGLGRRYWSIILVGDRVIFWEEEM